MTADGSTNGTSTSPRAEDSSVGDGPAALSGSTAVSIGRAVGRRVTRWVRGSAIYRWLTAEPDPDVIVIDLRETWTVGPFLRVLDRVVDLLVDASRGSRVVAGGKRGVDAAVEAPLRAGGLAAAAFGLVVAVAALPGEVSVTTLAVGLALSVAGLVAARDTRDWETLRETRPVQLAIAAFEPPEPPAREGEAIPEGEATGGEDEDDHGSDVGDADHGSDADHENDGSAGHDENDPVEDESGRSLGSVFERDPEKSEDGDRTKRNDR